MSLTPSRLLYEFLPVAGFDGTVDSAAAFGFGTCGQSVANRATPRVSQCLQRVSKTTKIANRNAIAGIVTAKVTAAGRASGSALSMATGQRSMVLQRRRSTSYRHSFC